ncbi:hypothetical protein Bca52824_052072 [Brassica carinata]|uniref:Pectinesterase n=1 Tax=Brassica carinata TaxID=52824 RepID=A0A8X7R3B1_BRACI|nr:hypothetical protein Bca52824_052072 [Brassica carinata]
MMHKIYLLSLHLLLLLLLCFNPLTTVADDNSTTGGIDGWCDQTPYPDPCKCYFKNHNGFLLPTQLSEFRIMLVEATMDRAISARDELAQSSRNCTDCRKQAVLADCIDLYGDTIVQLTRTLEGVSPKAGTGEGCTDFDAQTWLSTALTNTETCRRGSSDLNVSDFITPIVSNTKISNLISNCLAVNGSLLPTGNNGTTTADGKGFPTWVSSKERRLLQLQSARAVRANLVVAKDGSGQVNTVQAAVDVAGRRKVTTPDNHALIYVKKGIYQENINVRLNNDNIMLVGDGMRSTIITGTILSSVKGGYTTYNSATTGIEGLHFIAKGLTFQNTAGPAKGQAVELRSSSDLSIFYKCSIEGYQDTLMVHSQRQFYRGCYIYGTVDFIFGNAAVVFQNCLILPRPPLKGQANVITAQGRADPFQNTGISIHNSRIQPAPDLKPVVRTVKTYMGRPWMKYSRTVVLKTHLDSAVSPLGWSPWTEGSVFGLDTLFCAEYKNIGPGSSTKWRVRWKGFHVLNRDSDASAFTVGRFIASTVWLPHTGVPFTSGL